MDFKDYAGYYIGCRCFNTWLSPDASAEWWLEGYCPFEPRPYRLGNEIDYTWTDSIKPILRKPGDYEVGELNEYQTLIGKRTDGVHSVVIHYETPESFHWLLKKGFDLFGLIDAGLAIDSKTLK